MTDTTDQTKPEPQLEEWPGQIEYLKQMVQGQSSKANSYGQIIENMKNQAHQSVNRESLLSLLGLIAALWPVQEPDLWLNRVIDQVRPVEAETMRKKLSELAALCEASSIASTEAEAEHRKKTGYPDRYSALIDVDDVLKILDGHSPDGVYLSPAEAVLAAEALISMSELIRMGLDGTVHVEEKDLDLLDDQGRTPEERQQAARKLSDRIIDRL